MMFEELDVTLPRFTQYLMASARVFARFGFLVPGLILLAIPFFYWPSSWGRAMTRVERGFGEFLQRLVYFIPFMHGSLRRAHLAEFCRELGMLLRVGTPAPRAFRVIADGTMNPWFRDRVRRAAELCEGGVNLADALDRARLDHRVGWFARAAGTTGDLATGLYELGEDYAARTSWAISVAARLIPPMLILGVGFIVAWVVVALLLPLVSLMNAMGG